MLSTTELRYLAFVLASEEGPLHELPTKLVVRFGYGPDAATEVSEQVMRSLLSGGHVSIDQGPFAPARSELSPHEAHRLLASPETWVKPKEPGVDVEWSLLLTECGWLEFDNGFQELSRDRARQLVFGSAA